MAQEDDEDDIVAQALHNKEYYQKFVNGFEVPIPTFAKVSSNVLFLAEHRLSTGMAIGLQTFLESSKL